MNYKPLRETEIHESLSIRERGRKKREGGEEGAKEKDKREGRT